MQISLTSPSTVLCDLHCRWISALEREHNTIWQDLVAGIMFPVIWLTQIIPVMETCLYRVDSHSNSSGKSLASQPVKKGGAQYAVYRAVQYAYEKGYKDAQKTRVHYHSFKKVLDETDKKDLDELKDRLDRESIGELTYTDIADLTASQIRELLEETKGGSQRYQGGHKEKRHGIRRDKSRTRSHHPRSPRRNQKNRGKRFEDLRRRVRGDSEDSSSSESDDEEDYAYW